MNRPERLPKRRKTNTSREEPIYREREEQQRPASRVETRISLGIDFGTTFTAASYVKYVVEHEDEKVVSVIFNPEVCI